MAIIPTDPLVTNLTLRSSGGKHNQSDPLNAVSRDIPDGLSYLWKEPQIVILGKQLLEAFLFIIVEQGERE